jgi:hypothetical protein
MGVGMRCACGRERANLMLLDGATLYFAQGMTALPGVSELPEEWAAWSCRDGLFSEYIAAQTQIEEGSG